MAASNADTGDSIDTAEAAHRAEKTVVISGANGFLGRAACKTFTEAGYEVRALVRNPGADPSLTSVAKGGVFRCNLPDDIDAAAFRGAILALIHCAYATQAVSASEARRVNVGGTEALVALARGASTKRIVFVSSLSAHEEAESVYGRTKLELERRFEGPADAIVRPGTIVGPGGVFARTRAMLRSLPVVPLFFADRKLQTVWIDDVCASLLAIVQRDLSGRFIVAHPDAIGLADFYRGVASLDGRAPRLAPFPGNLAILLCRAAEKVGLPLPIHSDNLLGFRRLRWFDPRLDLERLGVRPVSFPEALARLRP